MGLQDGLFTKEDLMVSSAEIIFASNVAINGYLSTTTLDDVDDSTLIGFTHTCKHCTERNESFQMTSLKANSFSFALTIAESHWAYTTMPHCENSGRVPNFSSWSLELLLKNSFDSLKNHANPVYDREKNTIDVPHHQRGM
ncbi:hypothetical protein RF11_08343 [Thelohanellus kitauei]|uniref:Uncharacterized protein n=1 Tax=Thelohanellus kitauei TaxID=669202 RepID=A0A0C2NGC4_THEKT|nr:hypothetical protein RF11_08343 [Thelohanellus kitauei]